MNRSVYLTIVLILAMILVQGSVSLAEPYRVLDVTDPNGLDSTINSLGFDMAAEIGNYSVSQFNSHPKRIVFTMDTTDGYPPQFIPPGNSFDRIGTVYLTTSGGSPVNMSMLFENPRFILNDFFTDEVDNNEGYTRIFYNDTDAWRTSGNQSLVYKIYWDASAKIIFGNDVYGFGFTVNRLEADMTVKLLDASGTQIGSDYVVASNSAGVTDNHSFFGYYNHNAAAVRAVEFDLGEAYNQFSIDDIVVVADTTGLPECFGFATVGDINQDCYINLLDFAILASNWLEITPVE